MSDTVVPTETVTTQAPSNEPSVPATTPVVNAGQADVEAAKREAEQARMRANQLENELKAFKDAQAEAQQKQLLEKEEFKTLYEQTTAQLAEIKSAQENQERQKALEAATTEVLSGYSADVQELAKTAGLGLTETTDAAKASLKEKLDAFQAKFGSTAPAVQPNNPNNPTPNPVDRASLTHRDRPGGESVMAVAAANGDITPQLQYIRELPAIKRMKEIANGGA